MQPQINADNADQQTGFATRNGDALHRWPQASGKHG
jgi:hypothetical protein